MKPALNSLGIMLMVFGCTWILQGISILPGSFMSGQIRWSIYGGIAVLIGIVLLVVAKRRTGA